MSNIITTTALSALLALAVAPSVPAAAQEAIMLEAHGFVRMVQPEPPRQVEAAPQRSPQADEQQHASAE